MDNSSLLTTISTEGTISHPKIACRIPFISPIISFPIINPITITDLFNNHNNRWIFVSKIPSIIIQITPKTCKILTINKGTDPNSRSNKTESIWWTKITILSLHKSIISHGTKWLTALQTQETPDSKINSGKDSILISSERKTNSLICTPTHCKMRFKKSNQKWKSSKWLNRTDRNFQAESTLRWCLNQLMIKLASCKCWERSNFFVIFRVTTFTYKLDDMEAIEESFN